MNFPKFFRRQAEHFVRRAINQNVPESLVGFIATRPNDLALETGIFLKLKAPRVGSKPRPEFQQLATFLEQNKFPIGPEIVFWEKDAILVKKGTKTEIKKW